MTLKNENLNKMILIFKTNGEFVRTVNTVGEAAEVTKQGPGNVSTILSGKHNQVNGYTYIRSEKPKIISLSAKVKAFFLHKQVSIKEYANGAVD